MRRRGGDERRDADAERRFDEGREVGRVVRRDVFGQAVDGSIAAEERRVGAADEPVHERHAGRGREHADILAGGDDARVDHVLVAEGAPERRSGALGRGRVVHGEREAARRT